MLMPLLMLPRARLVGWVAIALCVGIFLVPRVSFAQSIAIANKISLERLDSNGNSIAKRTPELNPEGINLQDCRDGQKIRFPLTLSFATGDVVEVWATDQGADCSTALNRSGSVQVCYQMPVQVPLVTTPTVDIPVASIIAGLDSTQLDANGCRQLQAKTPIDVQFLLFRTGTQADATAKDDVSINVKTLGPAPLSGLTVQPGDKRLSIAWQAQGEAGAQDILGVTAFCEIAPIPSQGGTQTVCDDGGTDISDPDAGDSGTIDPDAGDLGTVDTSDAGCVEVPLPAGVIPAPGPGFSSDGLSCSNQAFTSTTGTPIVPGSEFDPYVCGSLQGVQGNTVTATDVGDTPLANNQIVAVAIAARDSFGNLGQLSAPVCQYPEETTDFWRNYRAAGGAAGGGFCSVNGPGTPVANLALFGFAALAFAGWFRKRAKNR